MEQIRDSIKATGATFTPEKLANFLANHISKCIPANKSNLVVLDPSCGEGALLKEANKVFGYQISKLIGYDTNQDYLDVAKNLLSHTNHPHFELICNDFLSIDHIGDSLFTENCSLLADIIIANPPYVRTQQLGAAKAQAIAKKYNLSGKVDLYYPFLIEMTNSLREGGILGVITSNRYISNKSGADIRKYLREHYDILEIIDLGDTKLFDAAVLPAIFIGRKKNTQSPHTRECKSMRIYEDFSDSCSPIKKKDIYDVINENMSGCYSVDKQKFNYQIGTILFPSNLKDCWALTSAEDKQWIDKIQSNCSFFVGERFKVRVGIKSCADNVFINANWQDEEHIPEQKILRKMISQENITRWKCDNNSCSDVLYPHFDNNGKRDVYDLKDYPEALLYLEKHRKQLEARTYVIDANRKWYEMWVPQDPRLWAFPKIVFPDISTYSRFCFDNSGAIVNGNCYWIVAKTKAEEELLLLIEGVANSSIMEKYHDISFNNKLYSGRRRYFSQYIEKYPIPDPTNSHSQAIIKLVRIINNNGTATPGQTKLLDELVQKAFDLL